MGEVANRTFPVHSLMHLRKIIGLQTEDLRTYFGTNLPPKKCLPMKSTTPCFGAVRLNKTSAFSPTPKLLPSSTSHPEGMSTETIGKRDSCSRGRTASNGALIGGLNENPKMASMMTSELRKALRRSSMSLEGGIIGICMFSHCFWRRFDDLKLASAPSNAVSVKYLIDIFCPRLPSQTICMHFFLLR